MGALAIACGVQHGAGTANVSNRIPQACGRDAQPPHTGGGMTQLLTLREVMHGKRWRPTRRNRHSTAGEGQRWPTAPGTDGRS